MAGGEPGECGFVEPMAQEKFKMEILSSNIMGMSNRRKSGLLKEQSLWKPRCTKLRGSVR